MRMLASLVSGAVATSALLLAPGAGWAQQPGAGAYLGGSLGYFRLNDEDFPDSDDEFKDNRWSWRAQAGIQFNPVFSLEGGYLDFGDLDDGSMSLSADGSFVAALVHLPLSEGIAPYGKLGQLWWDAEREASTPIGTARSTSDGNDTFYGVGLRFGEGPGWQMRLEYDRMALDDTDVDMASVNLQYRF